MLKVLLQSQPCYTNISRLQRLFSVASGMGVVGREGAFPLKEDSHKTCACFADRELAFATPEKIWRWGGDLQRHLMSGVCCSSVSSSLKAWEQKSRAT